jgi:hypothetical protein
VCSLGFEKLMAERTSRRHRTDCVDDGGGHAGVGADDDDAALTSGRSVRDAIIQHLSAVPRQAFMQAMLPIVEAMIPHTSPSTSVRPSGRKPQQQQQQQQLSSNLQHALLQRRGSMMIAIPPPSRRAPSVTSSVTSLLATAAPVAVVDRSVPQHQPSPTQLRSPPSCAHPSPPDTPMLLPLVLSEPLLQPSEQFRSSTHHVTTDMRLNTTISEDQLLASSASVSVSPQQAPPHHSLQHYRHHSGSNPVPSAVALSPDSAVTPPPTSAQNQRRPSRRQFAALKLPKYAVALLQNYMTAPGGPFMSQASSSSRFERLQSEVL